MSLSNLVREYKIYTGYPKTKPSPLPPHHTIFERLKAIKRVLTHDVRVI